MKRTVNQFDKGYMGGLGPNPLKCYNNSIIFNVIADCYVNFNTKF